MITWFCTPLTCLTAEQIYALLKLRVDIFVVEQNCPYPELDGKDLLDGTLQLLGYYNHQLVACARLLPAGVSYPEVSIGRVAIDKSYRDRKWGQLLLEQALIEVTRHWGEVNITIGAQQHLQRYYEKHGFKPISIPYLEDGIPHIDMQRISLDNHSD